MTYLERNSNEEIVLDDEILKPIGRDERVFKGIDLFLLWAGGNTCLATIFTGGILGPRLGVFYSLVIIIIASTIGGFLLGLVALLGEKKGLPTMVLTREVVTVKGSYLASILNTIQLIGWTSILLYASAEAIAEALKALFGEGLISNILLWVIIIGFLETAYTILGPRKWVFYQRVAVTTLLIVLSYEAYELLKYMLQRNIVEEISPTFTDFLWGFDMVLATAISWAPLVADYSRFASSSSGAVMGTWWGYTLTSYILYYIGALAAIITGAYLGDPTRVAISLGLSVAVFIFIAISAVTTNLLNIYSAVISTKNIFPKANYKALTIFYGILSTVLSMFPVFFMYFEGFLYYIGSVFVPLIAVLLSQNTCWFLSKKLPRKKETMGLISWIIGIAIGALASTYMKFGATIIAFTVSFIINYVLLTSLRKLVE